MPLTGPFADEAGAVWRLASDAPALRNSVSRRPRRSCRLRPQQQCHPNECRLALPARRFEWESASALRRSSECRIFGRPSNRKVIRVPRRFEPFENAKAMVHTDRDSGIVTELARAATWRSDAREWLRGKRNASASQPAGDALTVFGVLVARSRFVACRLHRPIELFSSLEHSREIRVRTVTSCGSVPR